MDSLACMIRNVVAAGAIPSCLIVEQFLKTSLRCLHTHRRYEWWLLVDYWGGNNGLTDTFEEPKSIAESISGFHGNVVLVQVREKTRSRPRGEGGGWGGRNEKTHTKVEYESPIPKLHSGAWCIAS